MLRTDPVFKFRKVNSRLEDILKNNRLYLASPESFNDPFDASISPIMDIEDADFRNWYIMQTKRNKQLSEPQQKKALEMLETGEYKSDEAKEAFVKGWQEGLREYGICSLSQNISHILQWSHYADNHKGVAVGIEVQKLEAKSHSMTEVHYSSQYPNVQLHDTPNYQEVLKRKYLCWEYEKEVRILKFGGAGSYLELPSFSIKQVVFGMKCPQDDFLKVMSWINWEKMDPDIVGAAPVNGRYELRFYEKAKKQKVQG